MKKDTISEIFFLCLISLSGLPDFKICHEQTSLNFFLASNNIKVLKRSILASISVCGTDTLFKCAKFISHSQFHAAPLLVFNQVCTSTLLFTLQCLLILVYNSTGINTLLHYHTRKGEGQI